MKKTIAFIFFCALWALSASAQNTVESIRKVYQEVHEMMAQMTPDKEGMSAMPPEYFDLQVVQNLPATGGHKENIRMYYGELEPEEEGDPYPPHYLRFTTAKYNFAAREFYEEYLYDDKGQVMFIYAYTPNEDLTKILEFRLYFDGQRLLQLNVKADETDVYKGTTIPEEYSGYCSLYTDRARHNLDLFKAIDSHTHL